MQTLTEQTSENSEITEQRIYVACLAAYNNGHLHGQWINANQDVDDINAEIHDMLKKAPIPNAEEWAIHDFEGFEGVSIQEYSSIETAAVLAEFIGKHGSLGAKLISNFGGNIDDAKTALDHHAGEYQNLAGFAQELTEQTTEIPPNLVYYIDYAAMARDMELNGTIYAIELGFDQLHVFWAH